MSREQNNIAARIRRAREQSQMEPAELRVQLKRKGIDLSKAGLHRLETMEARNPNLKLIQAIADITNVSPGWILFGQGPAVPEDKVGAAIRSRIIDTIELMAGALDLTAQQEQTLRDWLASARATKPGKTTPP